MATNNESTPARRIDDHRPAVALEWTESGAQQARAPFDRPDQWTILLTSSNHGLVGAHGHNFPHATGDFVRVNVCDEAIVAGLRERIRKLEAAATVQPSPADVRSAVARAIWNIRREEEDRCDMELEDMGDDHSVWMEADAAIRALMDAPAAAQSKIAPTDAELLDYLDGWVSGNKVDGLTHFVFAFDASATAREQIAQQIEIERRLDAAAQSVESAQGETGGAA